MATSERHPFYAGAILVTTWGHRAANIDFYQVTRATSKTVLVPRVEAQVVVIAASAQTVVSPISNTFRRAASASETRGVRVARALIQLGAGFALGWSAASVGPLRVAAGSGRRRVLELPQEGDRFTL